jgi:hypothetical protein
LKKQISKQKIRMNVWMSKKQCFSHYSVYVITWGSNQHPGSAVDLGAKPEILSVCNLQACSALLTCEPHLEQQWNDSIIAESPKLHRDHKNKHRPANYIPHL